MGIAFRDLSLSAVSVSKLIASSLENTDRF